ncbi:unnamed protein product, partial [Nesidiocoris tenuis]
MPKSGQFGPIRTKDSRSMVAWQVGTNQVPFSASEHQNGQRPDETNRPFERISYGHPTLK